MAVKLYEIDSIRWNGKTIDYPQGKFLDNTADNILDGSYCSSLWANDLFGFHGAILKNAGVEPNGQVETASNSQVFDALKTIIRQDIESFGGIPSAVASGSADAITANFTEEVTLTNGMYVQVRAKTANKTTTPTFNPNNLGAKTIVKGNNQPLAVGDIAGAGQWLHLTYDATLKKWVLNNPTTGVDTIKPYTANLVVYVGTNGNDGMADGTQEKPFLTIQGAMQYIAKTYGCLSAYWVTIKFTTDFSMENSTSYLNLFNLNGCSRLTIDGYGNNVILSPVVITSQYCIFLKDLILKQTPKLINATLLNCHSSHVYINNIEFDVINGSNIGNIIISRYGSFIETDNNITISIDANATVNDVFDIYNNSSLLTSTNTKIICNGTATNLISVEHLSNVIFFGNSEGNFIGKKYNLLCNSRLDLNGRGTSVLVGSEGTKDETSIIC